MKIAIASDTRARCKALPFGKRKFLDSGNLRALNATIPRIAWFPGLNGRVSATCPNYSLRTSLAEYPEMPLSGSVRNQLIHPFTTGDLVVGKAYLLCPK